MSKENIDYRAIVERITEMLHGGVTDIGLLTVTVQSYKDRLAKVEAERDELLAALVSLAAVARRYLPDYDEHPEVQKADDAIARVKGGAA
ncbi:hypothetical protein [Cronobacter sakazakii]|uniref:hypothetical protein n=1 Tax=Cronobacter sakazakii TaxID=28141 RepID=UPI000CFC53F0|nr:hypothetical protein [Cronobacter sakazakii]